MLKPTLLDARVPTQAVATMSQKERVRTASRTVQLVSGEVAASRLSDAPAGPEGTVAPSGSRPMSSGRRRMRSTTGMIRAKLRKPKYRNPSRQVWLKAMSANSWMFIAPAMGRKVETMARARLRRRRKKLTAAVRGTRPIRTGLDTARATIYAA